MIEKLTEGSIHKFRISITVALLVAIYGVMAYLQLPKAEDPGFIIRAAQVKTAFPGASSERVEQLVTDKLEEVIQEMPEIDYMKSESFPGKSVITVNIKESYTDMQPIWDTLRRKVDKAKGDLPAEVIGPVVDDEFGDVFGTVVTIKGKAFSYKELEDVADQVRNELLYLPDVAKVEQYGIQDERIYIELQDAKIAEMGSSSEQLKSFLQSANIIQSGGELVTGQEKIFLEPTGNYETVEDIENTVLYSPNAKEVIYLKDIADVKRGYVDPYEQRVYDNLDPAIVLAISMREGGNISQLGEGVAQTIEEMRQKYPLGLEFNLRIEQAQVVEESIRNFVMNIFQAIAIVVAIMLVVFGIRTGLIVASLIPFTILATFMFMSIFDIWIDQISLAALIIALGMLVDNAIVMSESIIFKVGRGQTIMEGAISSAQELWVSLLTSSLTTSAAFLPIYLAESAVGEYTASLFKVVSIALLSSWVLAFTWIPLLCFYGLKVDPNHKKDPKDLEWLYRRYRRMLFWLCTHQKTAITLFTAFFVLAIFLFRFIPSSFFPENERAVVTLEFELPSGTNILKTEEVVRDVEQFIMQELQKDGSVVNWITFIGGQAPRYTLNYSPKSKRPEKAFIYLNTASYEVTDQVMKKIETYALEHFPELRLILKKMFYGTYVEAPVGFRLYGKKLDEVYEIRDAVEKKLSSIPGVKNVRDDWGERIKRIVVHVDQARAYRAGITNKDVAISLQTRITGYETTDFREGDSLIPVVLRSVESERDSIDKLKLLNVYSQNSAASVPLSQIADIELEWGPSKIWRRDRLKAVDIYADFDDEVTSLQKINKEMSQWLDLYEKSWPLGYFWEYSGETYESGKAQGSINEKLPLAALVIILLLIIQFDSFRLTTIVILTIPLSLIGVSLGLFVTQTEYGFMSFLGVVSLAGIIINNAIVLLEQVKLNLETKKVSPAEAVINACQLRLRPIVLTTCTTIGGLIPLLLGGGGMFEQMAMVIVSGLLFGGALTLGFVPLLYTTWYGISFENINIDEQKL